MKLADLNVRITPMAAGALEVAQIRTGRSEADVVNRALQLYAHLLAAQAGGDRRLVSFVDELGNGQPLTLNVLSRLVAAREVRLETAPEES